MKKSIPSSLIKQRRKDLGLTQSELRILMKEQNRSVGPVTISLWENRTSIYVYE